MWRMIFHQEHESKIRLFRSVYYLLLLIFLIELDTHIDCELDTFILHI